MTKIDAIKNMSAKELAVFLSKVANKGINTKGFCRPGEKCGCPYAATCEDNVDTPCKANDEFEEMDILWWLTKEN